MKNPSITILLNHHPDGMGYLYGQLMSRDGEIYRVDIMPPEAEWSGDIRLTAAFAPHPTDWVVYLDGEELARVSRRDDLNTIVPQKFLASR